METYRADLTAHVVPVLGPRQLQTLQPAELNALYADLLASGGRNSQGLSAKSVRNIHGTLHKLLSDAEKWGLAPRNVASIADAPNAPKPAMKTWTANEARTFLNAVADDDLVALWHLLANTRLRRSEALGLRWPSVDLHRGTLAVQDTVVMVANHPVLRSGTTKTSQSARVVALDHRTVTVLRDHRTRQNEERLRAGPLWADLDLVFAREDGSVLSPDWVTRRFQRLTKDSGLQPIGLHGLRHGWATLALQNGIPAKVVSERLGHASVSITVDRYSHVIEGMDREAAETVADVLA